MALTVRSGEIIYINIFLNGYVHIGTCSSDIQLYNPIVALIAVIVIVVDHSNVTKVLVIRNACIVDDTMGNC
jgi:hypothetical protein